MGSPMRTKRLKVVCKAEPASVNVVVAKEATDPYVTRKIRQTLREEMKNKDFAETSTIKKVTDSDYEACCSLKTILSELGELQTDLRWRKKERFLLDIGDLVSKVYDRFAAAHSMQFFGKTGVRWRKYSDVFFDAADPKCSNETKERAASMRAALEKYAERIGIKQDEWNVLMSIKGFRNSVAHSPMTKTKAECLQRELDRDRMKGDLATPREAASIHSLIHSLISEDALA